ncbi:MAG: HAD family phosphatase [Lachnospiraceae bacterium]|jgi:Cof subfamily protein (haloacid dehalogenase superfamily)|nr:HAD family phosphatase [Lachnospiraceae bacterium]
MKRIKLIAFDLDGTLLKNNKELTPRTLKALGQASEAGICLVPTTGRLYDGVPEEIRALPFIRYVIAANGAQIYDAREERTLYRAEMNMDEVRQFFAYTREVPAITGCYRGGQGFMARSDMEKMAAYTSEQALFLMMRRVYKPVENLEDFLFETGEPVQKLMLFFADLGERKRILRDMKVSLSGLAVTSSVANNIEVNAREANKGAALRYLWEYLGIERDETAAFGDGSNDITMLLEAGTGYAMENACPEAKEAADRLAPSNEQEGVAFEIERLLS